MKMTRRLLMQSAAFVAAAPAVNMWPTGAGAAEFSFKYGNQVPANHPVTVGFQQAVDRIKAETGGRVSAGPTREPGSGHAVVHRPGQEVADRTGVGHDAVSQCVIGIDPCGGGVHSYLHGTG